jgi:endonuclease/exonuclease/phosphatase family metal-dependent hydrolase
MANNLPRRMGKNFFQNNLKNFITVLNREKPDIIAFQEIDYHSNRSHYIDQLETIARRSKYPFTTRAINWDKRYVPFPYWPPSAHFGKVLSGQAVISHYPLQSSQRIVLDKPANKPFYYRVFYLDRLIQIAKIRIGSAILVTLNVHLEAFEQKTRENQARKVLRVYRSYKDQFPVLLMGDFNSIPPKATQKGAFSDEPETDFSTDKTMEIFMQEKSLKAAMVSSPANFPETETFTFPSDNPSRKLDYIFYNHQKIVCLNAYVVNLDSSDHLPVVMEFAFKEKR